jgi:hypothetical protein
MRAELLRNIAASLRKEAAALEQRKTVKCAQVLDAATALMILRNKVSTDGI